MGSVFSMSPHGTFQPLSAPESPQEVVHEVHEVTFMLPQKPKNYHMNQSHQSLPLPHPKACKASGLIVLPSQRPSHHPMRCHLCTLSWGSLCSPHQDGGPAPWAALTLVSLSLVPIQVAARAVPCPWL